MLKAIGKYPQCDRLSLCLSLFRRRAVSHGAWNIDYICDPTTILFLIEFDFKDHQNLWPQFYRSGAESPTGLPFVGMARITAQRSAASGARANSRQAATATRRSSVAAFG